LLQFVRLVCAGCRGRRPDTTFPGAAGERRNVVVAAAGSRVRCDLRQRAALFGGERARVCSRTKQDRAGRRQEEVSMELGGGPVSSEEGRGRAHKPRTKAGLTTFRLETVSWLECRPLAALVCSVQRPNAGSASPTTRWFRRGPIKPRPGLELLSNLSPGSRHPRRSSRGKGG
jgi:hypothetical protein